MRGDLHKAIIFMALMALLVLTVWLPNALVDPVLSINPQKSDSPDYFIENFTSAAMDERGRLKHELSAAKLLHYPNDQSAYLEKPYLIQYSPNGPPIHTVADKGRIYNDGKELLMTGNVQVIRGEHDGRPGGEIQTQKLHVILN